MLLYCAGLVPGFARLYPVNALVPERVEKGPDVPVVLALVGSASPVLTVPVQERVEALATNPNSRRLPGNSIR